MKLYLLHPIEASRGAWDPWYDRCFGMVICAEDESQARSIAQESGGDEVRYGRTPWLDPAQSSCEVLEPGEVAGVIIQDNHSA